MSYPTSRPAFCSRTMQSCEHTSAADVSLTRLPVAMQRHMVMKRGEMKACQIRMQRELEAARDHKQRARRVQERLMVPSLLLRPC